jgi:predicted DNA-binding transcriptional regulator AlpA
VPTKTRRTATRTSHHTTPEAPTTPPLEPLLRVREVAAMLNGGRPGGSWRLYALLAQGKGPPHIKIGTCFFFRRAAVEGWLVQQEITSGQQAAAQEQA